MCIVMLNKLYVDVNVLDEGYYILMVYVKRDKEEEFVNIINYMMIFDRKNLNVEVRINIFFYKWIKKNYIKKNKVSFILFYFLCNYFILMK